MDFNGYFAILFDVSHFQNRREYMYVLSRVLSLSLTHTYTHTHTIAHAHAHHPGNYARKHTYILLI
jgi:hypothetical protein